ncbi:type II toxin-antitoxin system RelE/ParE family toxin [Shinella zoogloeoides]|uniref:type II toxin-antitoxin system RelE/ParE family toxin n=1 Tax=Shinella zoogloeoides TaxID=352475 RepID=UPI00273DC8FA|nr:type II toxin-antitoxin system RelE/ParE family toxin [Shinella zoogloeoides]WLR93609.1 type II toxin-antitoxin system RelE/ParE family toxin [Shinella zoogloeoides]
MKRPVRWSRAALDDLKQQIRHIAKDDPVAARSVAGRIDAAATLLGERAVGRPGRVGGTYEKSVNGLPYVIAYCMDMAEGRETLFILRVIHTARQWRREEWPD